MPHGRKTKVINPSEYNRIKASLNAHETAEIARHQKEQEKERLRNLSRKQVNSWNNTLSGQRKETRFMIYSEFFLVTIYCSVTVKSKF